MEHPDTTWKNEVLKECGCKSMNMLLPFGLLAEYLSRCEAHEVEANYPDAWKPNDVTTQDS